MTNEIQRQCWKQFFKEVSKNQSDLRTRVEVTRRQAEAKIISDGLPLAEAGYSEVAGGRDLIEIRLGERSRVPQIHVLFAPRRICYYFQAETRSFIIAVEDGSGVETLVHLFEPARVWLLSAFRASRSYANRPAAGY